MALNSDTQALARDIDGRLAAIRGQVESIKTNMRRGRVNNTLAEFIEWEREFGPYRTGRNRVELCKSLARKYGVPYREVEHTLPWFADVPEGA